MGSIKPKNNDKIQTIPPLELDQSIKIPKAFANVAQLEIMPTSISLNRKGQNLSLKIQFLNQNQEVIHLENPPLIFHSSNPQDECHLSQPRGN